MLIKRHIYDCCEVIVNPIGEQHINISSGDLVTSTDGMNFRGRSIKQYVNIIDLVIKPLIAKNNEFILIDPSLSFLIGYFFSKERIK